MILLYLCFFHKKNRRKNLKKKQQQNYIDPMNVNILNKYLALIFLFTKNSTGKYNHISKYTPTNQKECELKLPKCCMIYPKIQFTYNQVFQKRCTYNLTYFKSIVYRWNKKHFNEHLKKIILRN